MIDLSESKDLSVRFLGKDTSREEREDRTLRIDSCEWEVKTTVSGIVVSEFRVERISDWMSAILKVSTDQK
jgi:hypothetical protein